MIKLWVLAIGSLSFIASLAAQDVQKDTPSSGSIVGSLNAVGMSGTLYFSTVVSSPSIALVSKDGEVSINWEAAEKIVAEANTDPTTLAIARLMLAIRDGTWKPLR